MSLLYPAESYNIIGAAMEVYNNLGAGFAESVYQEAFEIELKKRNIPFRREQALDIFYKNIKLNKSFQPDFICYDKIIVELKAVMELDDLNRKQVYNYLKASKMQLGLLINFGNYDHLEHERKVMTDLSNNYSKL